MVSNRLFLFQSRNRGSFDFKLRAGAGFVVSINAISSSLRFNLAIEVLLISRRHKLLECRCGYHTCFNLAIEVLLVSSDNDVHRSISEPFKRAASFNLVIEVLLISRME